MKIEPKFPLENPRYPSGTIVRMAAWHTLHKRAYIYALLTIDIGEDEVLWYRTGLVREPPCPPGVFHGWEELCQWLNGGAIDVTAWEPLLPTGSEPTALTS